MKKIRDQIFKVLWSRLGRNIIFWAIILWVWLHDRAPVNDYPQKWYVLFRTIMCTIMLILSYVNNLVLVPTLLVKRKYIWYIISAAAFTFVMSFTLAAFFITAIHYFPKMNTGNFSFLNNTMVFDYSFKGFIMGTQDYFVILLVWVSLFNMAWYMNDYARQQRVAEEAKKKQVESELSFLKGQINPHFLFNNMNNLYGLALQKSENTPGAILKLSSILRYLLYESDIEKVSFDKEKEVMNSYIDLELLRLSDTGNLHFTIMADHPYEIPPLLWMPVLENVFKHATRVITDQYFIEFRFEIRNNEITIYSKNNFKWNEMGDHKEKTGGIGLQNLKKRLALLYPGRHRIQTSYDDRYYTTEVKINLA